MKTRGQYESEAVAISHATKFHLFYSAKKRNARGEIVYRIFRKIPGGVSLIAETTSPARLSLIMRRNEAQMIGMRRNPSPREDEAGAEKLATRFHGRAPDEKEYYRISAPKLPKAMACIGKIFAVEYLAERDGKEFRFRHVFKAKSRPHLAVSPDGNIAAMLGGAWFFGEDGFEDV